MVKTLSIKDEKTKKREIRSLIKAYSDFKYHQDDIELILITMDRSSTEEIDGKIIKIINILEWLILT